MIFLDLEPAPPFDWVKMKFSKTTPIDTQDTALKSAALSLGLTLP